MVFQQPVASLRYRSFVRCRDVPPTGGAPCPDAGNGMGVALQVTSL